MNEFLAAFVGSIVGSQLSIIAWCWHEEIIAFFRRRPEPEPVADVIAPRFRQRTAQQDPSRKARMGSARVYGRRPPKISR
jgi:hypothetical protein